MIQKHLLLLAFPNPALAVMVEEPPASKGWGSLQAVDDRSHNTRTVAFAYRHILANMGQICLALRARRLHHSAHQ